MLDNLNLRDILFLDIETVPIVKSYEDLSGEIRPLWDKKAKVLIKDEIDTVETMYERAGIYAEFGKIICISVGFIHECKEGKEFRVKSFYGDNEKTLLLNFAEMLNKSYNSAESLLCAHNGKEFDYPYIARRMLINSIKLPRILDIAGKKPWEVKHLDTLELWKFGDYKSYTSLNLLATIFNIPTPKDDINGSEVARVYYEEKNLERIVTYCQKDTLTVAQLILRFRGEDIIEPNKMFVI